MNRQGVRSFPLGDFNGLDLSSPVGPAAEGFTRSLKNVQVRHKRVTGRGGVTYNTTLSAAASENIIGLFVYTGSDPVKLIRLGTTAVGMSANAAAWSDITGNAFTGNAADRPQGVMFRDSLVYTSEGRYLPRKYTGSSNTTALSGSAPYCKAIASYYGYFFALNTSSNGSSWSPRQAIYTDDIDDWTSCTGNTLQFNETPGDIVAMGVSGLYAVVFKTDGLVFLQWIGGEERFLQRRIKFGKGTIAPLSVQNTEKGIIVLASDYELYAVDHEEVIALPPRVNEILQSDLHKASVGQCRSFVSEFNEEYNLFYPLDASGNKGRIRFNYRTGEFTNSVYDGHYWDAVACFPWSPDESEVVVGAANTNVLLLDTANRRDSTDYGASVAVDRYYDTDWIRYKGATDTSLKTNTSRVGECVGASFIFDQVPNGRVAVSIATDYNGRFSYRKICQLKRIRRDSEYVVAEYDLPPLSGEVFNFRVEFLPSSTTNPVLRSGYMHFTTSKD